MRSAFLVALFCVCVCALLESDPSRIAKASGHRIVGAEPEDGGEIAPAMDPCNGTINANKQCEKGLMGGVCGATDPVYVWYNSALPGGTNTKRFELTNVRRCKGAADCPNIYDANTGTDKCK